MVQPTLSSQADDAPTSITFWTANDAVERDPAAFELWGSSSADIPELFREDDVTVSGLNAGDVLELDLFTKIAEGPLDLPDSRNAGGAADLDDANSQTISFENSTTYDNYLILFPELKDRNGQNSMQIAEIQLNYDGEDIASGIFDFDDAVVGLAYADLTPPEPYACNTIAGDQPEPGAGFWSIREWNFPTDAPEIGTITSVDGALDAIAGSDPQLNCVDSNYGPVVFDGFASTVNHADPQGAGGGYSVGDPKQPFLSGTDGADDDFMIRARGKVIIPESGEYTIGVDGDDGFRLNVDGELFMEFPGTTGNAFTLEVGDFEAGEHDFELVWFERGGGAFVELFAAQGFKEELDGDFAPIGFQGFEGTQGMTATMADGWNVRVVDSEGALNSIADAEAALENGTELGSEQLEVVNLGGGNAGIFGDVSTGPDDLDDLFPGNAGGSDDFAVEATGTLVIPADGDYIFGFNGDDGGILCIDGADFTLLTEGGPRGVSGEGACIEYDGNTGSSDTSGTTFLAAGEYDIRHVMWERGGGEHAEVFASLGNEGIEISARHLLGRDSFELDTSVAPGLQLGGPELQLCDPNSGGDTDGNGTVDFLDFLALANNFGQTVDDHTSGDFDCSGTVDFLDFLTLANNFGQSAAAIANSESVPEPSSIALLGLAAMFIGVARRRRHG